MDIQTVGYYSDRLAHLRTDRTGGWTDQTSNRAPHKPLLLLSVLDQFAQGSIKTNLIELTPDLGDLFATSWSKVMPPERHGNMALPFFHLRSSGFWHLVAKPEMEKVVVTTRQIDTLNHLNRIVLGARFDEDLYDLLQLEEGRNALRLVLIKTYFAPDLHNVLSNLGQINLESYLFSESLIEQARKAIKDAPIESERYQTVVRDQGFRKAVIKVYDHRCAFCGVRMMTADGHSAIEAAHIIPWSDSHNDNPRNGMALCRLCHWTFDEGLTGVSIKYRIKLSKELRSDINMPGHLLTLENRSIIGPEEKELWPDLNALEWHQHEVFR
jgi:putative restriction endonuclease